MPPLAAVRQPPVVPVVKLRIYHCGNFLGIWAEGGGWYCRKCKKVIELLPNQWEIDSEASAGAQ